MIFRRTFAFAFTLPLVSVLASVGLASATPDAGAPVSDAGAAPEASTYVAPDPTPLVSKEQWVFDLRWDKGEVFLVAVHPLSLPAPQATPRAMGRFAIELSEGRSANGAGTLVERVRFDFPLLAVPEGDAGIRFSARLTTRIGVMFPQSKRGTLLELVDRLTGKRYRLPWPPLEGSPGDAGTDGAR